jgi:IclR family transcriptional regulator, acetate operon repressor
MLRTIEPPTTRPPAGQHGTQAVDRAVRLLIRVIEADTPQPFSALAEASGLPKSTTSRLLSTLNQHGLLQRDGDGAFRPGPVLARYADHGGTDELAAAAQSALERLGDRTGETVTVAVPTGGAVEQIAQVDSRYLLGATNWVGLRVPLHCSAPGKVFLAFGAVELPAGRLERRTPDTLTSRPALEQDLDRARARGYAVARDELESGLVAVAAPVGPPGGVPVAALCVSGPTVRLGTERIAEIGGLLAAEADRLLLALDHRRTAPG